MHPLPARRDADAGRLRRRRPERGADVRRRGARLPRGQERRPVRRPGGEAARDAPERHRPLSHRRLHRERAQVPPAGNRDPQPEEIEACESHLFRQIELIRPTLVATLGNFATKLLSGKPTGITRVHGVPQQVTLGGNEVTLYPLYHPAAALYTRSMLAVLEEDFARIPELLGRTTVVPEPAVFAPEPVAELEPEPEPESAARAGRPARAVLAARARAPVRLSGRDGGDRRTPRARTRSPVTSSRSRASSAPGRRRSSAAPVARSGSPHR